MVITEFCVCILLPKMEKDLAGERTKTFPKESSLLLRLYSAQIVPLPL